MSLDLDGDPRTKERLAMRLRRIACEMWADVARSTCPEQMPPEPVARRCADMLAENAREAYVAMALERLATVLETEAKLRRYPKLKCRKCGGDAHVCYPRHLEGKSCG